MRRGVEDGETGNQTVDNLYSTKGLLTQGAEHPNAFQAFTYQRFRSNKWPLPQRSRYGNLVYVLYREFTVPTSNLP